MRGLLCALVLAALLPGRAAAAVLRLHTGHAAQRRVSAASAAAAADAAQAAGGPDVPECTCDCCAGEVVNQGSHTSAGDQGELVCIPRAIDVAVSAGTAGCTQTCQASEAERVKFEAATPEVDYSRYCLKLCTAVGDPEEPQAAEHLICVNTELLVEGQFGAAGDAALALQAKKEPPKAAEAPTPPPQTQPVSTTRELSDVALSMAKAAMLEAKRHAEAAGQAARTARSAYEAILETARVMGKAASKAVLDDVRHAAGVQAREALDAKRRYEAQALARAEEAGASAAAVYTNAKERDTALAGTWALRAQQFEAAAEERAGAARAAQEQAGAYQADKDYATAREFATKAHTAEEQAELFKQRAEAAEEQAQNITEGLRWYDWAAEQAAAAAMAAVLPRGVPLPTLRLPA